MKWLVQLEDLDQWYVEVTADSEEEAVQAALAKCRQWDDPFEEDQRSNPHAYVSTVRRLFPDE